MVSTSYTSFQRLPTPKEKQVGRRIANCPTPTHFGNPCNFPEIVFPTDGTLKQQEDFVKAQLMDHYRDVSKDRDPRVVAPRVFEEKVEEALRTTIQYDDVSQRRADTANQTFQSFTENKEKKISEHAETRKILNEALARGEKGTFVGDKNYQCNICEISNFATINIHGHFKACLERNPQFKDIYVAPVKQEKKRKLQDIEEAPVNEGQPSQSMSIQTLVEPTTDNTLNLRQILNEALARGEQGTPVADGKIKCNICEQDDFTRIATHFRVCLERNPDFHQIYVSKEKKKRKKENTQNQSALEQTLPIHTQQDIPSSSAQEPRTSFPPVASTSFINTVTSTSISTPAFMEQAPASTPTVSLSTHTTQTATTSTSHSDNPEIDRLKKSGQSNWSTLL